jgi:RND superfamily putative drug exporter
MMPPTNGGAAVKSGAVFFFATVFALAMDYTVFLLATVKEHFDETGDARQAAIAGLAHTGRMIGAAGGVMVVVFLTFALSGPIPPKESASSSRSQCCSTRP